MCVSSVTQQSRIKTTNKRASDFLIHILIESNSPRPNPYNAIIIILILCVLVFVFFLFSILFSIKTFSFQWCAHRANPFGW